MKRCLLVLLTPLLAACIGEIGGPSGDATPAPSPLAVAAPTLRRLTTSELSHSVRDLLGDVTLGPVEVDSEQEGFFAVGASTVAVSPAGVAKYEASLDAATIEAFADVENLATKLACVPALESDEPCAREAIGAFGRRAWRRPLEPSEIDRYVTLADAIGQETGDAREGLRHALWGILQSPHFLYRNERGTPSPEHGGRLMYGPFEMASRLSFTLWNSLPDETLLDAAEQGDLSHADGIRAQAERLLSDPRGREGVANFVTELYGLWHLDGTFKDEAVFPAWSESLGAAMREDILRRVDHVVFTEPADFFSLYDDRQAFVNNELARVYGIPEAENDAFRRVDLPASGMRRGLTGSGAVLAMYSLPARTSATKRGQFISEAMLCITVPPPPPTVDTNLTPPAGSGPMTLRQKLEPHRKDPACAACHDITDPLGLALENFDGIGRFRETDDELPIDASGVLDGAYFEDGSELAARLREHPDTKRCLVRKLFTYVTGRVPESPETPILSALEAALAGADGHFDQLLLALVTSDDFRFAQASGTVLEQD